MVWWGSLVVGLICRGGLVVRRKHNVEFARGDLCYTQKKEEQQDLSMYLIERDREQR